MMPSNPSVIIFLASLTLIALYMAIEGVAFFISVGDKVLKSLKKNSLPPELEERLVDEFYEGTSLPHDAAPRQEVLAQEFCNSILSKGKPHLLIVGHTGGGKSVLVRALTNYLIETGAEVVALDPDAAPRHYPAPVQLINDDEQWSLAIAAIADEFGKRNEAYRGGKESFIPLWLVADECQELLAIDGVLSTVERVIRRGRKLNLHVCLAVQDSQVRTLGLERKSALLVNLSRVEVMRKGEGRVALLDGGEYEVPDFPNHYGEARGNILPSDTDTSIPATPLNSPILGGIDGDIDTGTDTGIPGIPDTDAVNHGITELGKDEGLILELLARGFSANKIYEVVGGNRNQVLGKIKMLKG